MTRRCRCCSATTGCRASSACSGFTAPPPPTAPSPAPAWTSAACPAFGGPVAGTAALAAVLLARSPDYLPWLGPVVLVAGAMAGLALSIPRFRGRLALATSVLALAALLAGPAAYAAATMSTAYQGGAP